MIRRSLDTVSLTFRGMVGNESRIFSLADPVQPLALSCLTPQLCHRLSRGIRPLLRDLYQGNENTTWDVVLVSWVLEC